ncbi:MAG: T9SS type A sorting domain-containing protein, partial [Lentimicrobiaceae bacterium]|nr:T9SS type A sorting domain-containing protein [Lentimicrobiaceae bacterium]
EVSTANPFEFAAMANRNLVGNFRVLVVYYIINATSNNNAWGTVSGGGKFEENLPVMLTATAKPGFEFENWTENGAVVSTTNPYTFTAAANRTVVGNFKKLEYTIEATSNNVNWGKVTGGGIFNPDAQVTLKATPEEGYEFINWTENGNPVTVENPYIFTATANRKLVGNFAEIIPESYTVTFTVKNAKTQEEIQNASITLNGVTQTGNYQFLHVTPGTYIYIVTAENYKNGSGSVAVFEDKTETVELEPLQSINDNVLSSVALYPNPFGNEINITNPEVVKSVEITTATGLKVKEVTFDGKTISTGSLSTGIYFITIESITGSKAVHKMVKK